MTRYYRFDQLFEKLPSGAYRERETPAPLLSIDHRHDYFRSPTTGRICVLYPAFILREFVARGDATIAPLTGGNWANGALIDYGTRRIDWN